MRYAVIHGGIVENVIDAPEFFSIPWRVLVEAPEDVAAGWTFDGDQFAPPALAGESVRFVSPYDFLGLFTQSELVQILQSVDPVVMVARAKIQTITSVVDLQSSETQQYIGYLVLQQTLSESRAARILAGLPPE